MAAAHLAPAAENRRLIRPRQPRQKPRRLQRRPHCQPPAFGLERSGWRGLARRNRKASPREDLRELPPSLRAPRPATRQHLEHVCHFLPSPDFAQMTAVIVDDYSGTQRILQPGELAFVED